MPISSIHKVSLNWGLIYDFVIDLLVIVPIHSTSANFSFGVASSIRHTRMLSEKHLEVLSPRCKQCFLSLQKPIVVDMHINSFL
jgi:hypothetical protein